MRLLLVDDEPSILRLLASYLTRNGYEVTSATSGAEALDHFRQAERAFQLAVIDRTLPDLPGDQLAHQLLTQQPDLPVLLTSGYPVDITEFAPRRVAYLQKPFLPAKLLEALQQLLQNQLPDV